MNGKELMQLRKSVNLKKVKYLPPNNVFVDARDINANRISVYCMKHDGSEEDMVNTARKLMGELGNYVEYSGIQSRLLASDEHGNPAYAISPNFLHIAEIGTPESRYIYGDISARVKI